MPCSIYIWYHESLKSEEQTSISAILDSKDSEHLLKLIHPEAKSAFLCGRWLLRNVLTEHSANSADLRVRDWHFEYLKNGKPVLAASLNLPNLHFSLSHTKNCTAVAISALPVGIDVEWIDPNFNFTKVAHDFFSPSNKAELDESAQPRQLFYERWTQNEARFKLSGDRTFAEIPLSEQKTWLLRNSFLLSAIASTSEASFEIFDFMTKP